jgi:predicted nucleic acid-binding protein
MIVYCDTSFLIGFLNEQDANHRTAAKIVGKWNSEDFVICALHLVEFPAGVRAAAHRQDCPIHPHVARGLINRFDRAVNGGVFVRRELPVADSVNMARSLGEAHGWEKRHTAFDLWHLGAAWAFSAGAFLSFDTRQSEVAAMLGMIIA